jgi:hypothetical protein
MFAKLCTTLLSVVACGMSGAAVAQIAPPPTPPPDTRLIPGHAQICVGNVVDKTKFFYQLLENASPAVTDKLKFSLRGDWHKLVADNNICPQFSGCGPKDAAAIASIQVAYAVFIQEGGQEGYYRATNPNLTIGQYFTGGNDVNKIICTSKDEPPAPPTTSPLDAQSPIRLRGISDDLWISQQSPLFAKSSAAAVTFTQNNSVTPDTATTSIQGALGYDIPIGTQSAALLQDLIPFVAGYGQITDTQGKPQNSAATNFVAGGFLYTANYEGAHQFTAKPQYVDGTTMKSQLTSLQVIYTPWTDAAASAPFPPLNTMINVYPGSAFFPNVNGQFLVDARNDVGYYGNRGTPTYVSQNANFERFGSKFGYAFIATPTSSLPTFTLSLTETYLYGATGAFRTLSYFDALLNIYLDAKHYFSVTLEYTNGRDENTYVESQIYKAGFAGHF